MSFWNTVKYFKPKEFESDDEPGSGLKMHPILVKMLDDIRDKLKEPIVITSGYRTQAKNKFLTKTKSGAVEDSAHLKGYAVDLYIPNSNYRFKLVDLIYKTGFLRLGVSKKSFVHVDMDPDKPQNVFWTYD